MNLETGDLSFDTPVPPRVVLPTLEEMARASGAWLAVKGVAHGLHPEPNADSAQRDIEWNEK
jgi:hypothetical protein